MSPNHNNNQSQEMFKKNANVTSKSNAVGTTTNFIKKSTKIGTFKNSGFINSSNMRNFTNQYTLGEADVGNGYFIKM